VVWDVLLPCVQPETTLLSLLIDLLTAVLGANIVCVVVMSLPVPHPALWLVRWRLEELAAVMAKFVEDAVASFCLEDDSGERSAQVSAAQRDASDGGPCLFVCLPFTQSPQLTTTPTTHPPQELYDLEGVLDEATALLQQARALLPDVRFELSLLPCGGRVDRAVAYDRLARYLTVLESQVENCRGMAVAVSDIFPNHTHAEFVRAMQPALLELAAECRVVLEGTCHHICHGLRLGCCGDGGGGGGGGWGRGRAGTGGEERDAWMEAEGVSGELFVYVRACMCAGLVGWLVDRLVDWLVYGLVGWLVYRFAQHTHDPCPTGPPRPPSSTCSPSASRPACASSTASNSRSWPAAAAAATASAPATGAAASPAMALRCRIRSSSSSSSHSSNRSHSRAGRCTRGRRAPSRLRGLRRRRRRQGRSRKSRGRSGACGFIICVCNNKGRGLGRGWAF
jgi:hypothetical protein